MSWLDAVVAARARTIMPQAPYIPQAPQTLADDPAAPAKAKPVPAGKGGGKFQEHLHVRGADGKFITKGGIVNVKQADGTEKRGRVSELTPDGPVVRYDDGTIETIPLASTSQVITPAPKPIARIGKAAARSQIRELPYEDAQKWNDWQRQVLAGFDPEDGCTQDAAAVIKTGQMPPGAERGCIGPADGPLAQFLQRIHREGAAALNQGSIGDDERAVGVLGAKLLGYSTQAPSGPRPKAAPKPKAPPKVREKAAPRPRAAPKPKPAPKAKKPKAAAKPKKKAWSPWG